MDQQFGRWRKSARSGAPNDDCVEVAPATGARLVGVRDSKDPEGGVLALDPASWLGLLGRVRTGRI